MNFALLSVLVSTVYAASCGILSANGCVDMIVKDAYSIGNQTRNIGCIAASIEPNCVFTMLKLQTATQNLIDTINQVGCAVNSACPSLELQQALPLVPVLEGLVPTITRSMSILSKKKCVFDHSILGVVSLSWLVKNDLNNVIEATQGMAYAIRKKVPETSYSIVDGLVAKILAPLDQARDVFSK